VTVETPANLLKRIDDMSDEEVERQLSVLAQGRG
jgi:hypothetical protein